MHHTYPPLNKDSAYRTIIKTAPTRSSPFGTIEDRSQWSATYRKIFRSFPQYDFIGQFQRDQNRDFRFPSTNPNPMQQLKMSPEIGYSSIRRQSPEHSPQSDVTHRSSKRVLICDEEARNVLKQRSSSSLKGSPNRISTPNNIAVTPTHTLPPLLRGQHDSAKEIEHPTNPIQLERALHNERVYAHLRDVIREEFPGGGVDCAIIDQPFTSNTIFDKTMRFSDGEKNIYVSLSHLISISNRRDRLRGLPLGSEKQSTPESEKERQISPMSNTTSTTTTSRSREPSVSPPHRSDWIRNNDERSVSQQSETSNNISPHSKVDSEPAESWRKKSAFPSETSLKTSTSVSPREHGHVKPLTPLRMPQAPDLSPPSFDIYVPELIHVVVRKIENGIPLDWADLFILKTFHCNRVFRREKELFALVTSSGRLDWSSQRARALTEKLHKEYEGYEETLQKVSLIHSGYTLLAHRILLAEAFWFHARITQDPRQRDDLYRRAIDNYSLLLERAEDTLPPDDVSLLTIAEKLTVILAESRNFDPQLVLKTALLMDMAEKRLERKPDAEAHRRIVHVKHNLATLNKACQVGV